MRRTRFGMVMIEFTMAAVGLVAIALVTVRVGHWLNDAMVERNASYQASRPAASDGPGLEPFGGPSEPLKLLGPPAALAPGAGTPGGGDSTVTPSCGSGWLGEATAKRWEAASLLMRGAAFTLDEQSQITYINAVNWNMLVEANYLANYAIRVDDILNDLVDRIYPRLLEIQEMDIVQGSGVYDFCNRSNVPTLPADVVDGISVPAHDLCPLQDPTGIHQIDERLNGIANELNPNVDGTVADEWDQLNTRRWEIIADLFTLAPPSADDPDGTLAWRRAAVFAAYLQAAAACNVAGQSVVAREMPISSCMGPDHPLGIDIDGVTGDTLHAFKGGRVIDIATGVPNCHADRSLCPGFNGGYGNYVVIDHGDGTMTWYSHLDTVGVTVGQEVLSGEEIGTMGNTGYSDGDHLHFEQHVRVDGVWTRVDPLGGQSCTEYVTTSDALGSGPAGTCDEALKNDLLHQLDHPVGEAGPGDLGGLNQQWDYLKDVVAPAVNARLDAVTTLYNYLTGQLWGLWGPYMESSGGWGLYPQTFNYLNEVDSIVSAWNPLWQQLHNERPADFPSDTLWDLDLFDLFRDTIQAWDDANANSLDTVVIEEIPGYLDVIIGRLLLLMRERLDHTDWSELPWFMGSDDYTGIIPSELVNRFSRFDVPWRSDDDHNPGGQREANERVMYLEGNPVIEHHLVNYNDEIRKLILDAEELERQARRECTSSPD